MSQPIKKDVQDTLDEFHDRIGRVVAEAWKEWESIARFKSENGYGSVMYPRTIANHVFDAIARLALNEFHSDPSVNVIVEPQTIKLVFKGRVLARFKKGDDSKLGRNVTTQAALNFTDVNQPFPGMPPKTAKVEFIWLPNEINTKLQHVLVVARDNDSLLWDYEIELGSEGEGSVVPFPARKPDFSDGSGDGLVRPKPASTKKTDED